MVRPVMGPKDWSPRGERWVRGLWEVHRFKIDVSLPDRRQHSSCFEVVFPRGTQFSGILISTPVLLLDGRERYMVEVRGGVPTGSEYGATYGVEFPPGSKILSVSKDGTVDL